MATELDSTFVERAAAFINLANEQAYAADDDHVAGSLMLATARFNAHVSAQNSESAQAMLETRSDQLDFIVQNFRTLLEGEYDFYTANYNELVHGEKAGG